MFYDKKGTSNVVFQRWFFPIAAWVDGTKYSVFFMGFDYQKSK